MENISGQDLKNSSHILSGQHRLPRGLALTSRAPIPVYINQLGIGMRVMDDICRISYRKNLGLTQFAVVTQFFQI